MSVMTSPTLVLASSSPYRRELLSRLMIPFEVCQPDVDEQRLTNESPEAMAVRLAELKARAVADRYDHALIIGSDQVCALLHDNGEAEILSKPGNYERTVAHLLKMSGKKVMFYTGLCLFNTKTGRTQIAQVPFTVQFRPLTLSIIENYLKKEQPFNCAGGTKIEGLGIALVSALSGDDPNALIGLPIIQLINMLQQESFLLF